VLGTERLKGAKKASFIWKIIQCGGINKAKLAETPSTTGFLGLGRTNGPLI